LVLAGKDFKDLSQRSRCLTREKFQDSTKITSLH